MIWWKGVRGSNSFSCHSRCARWDWCQMTSLIMETSWLCKTFIQPFGYVSGVIAWCCWTDVVSSGILHINKHEHLADNHIPVTLWPVTDNVTDTNSPISVHVNCSQKKMPRLSPLKVHWSQDGCRKTLCGVCELLVTSPRHVPIVTHQSRQHFSYF